MNFIKGIFLYVVTVLIILGYGIFLYILKERGSLTSTGFVNNITIFVGWIVALLIAWIHLQKTRRDNQLSKKEEIKKVLEINAFREINKAVSDFSGVLTSLYITYLTLPGKLRLHIQDPQPFKFNKIEVDLELNKQTAELHGGTANFLTAIESNEIVVIEFDHYRKYIQHRVDDVHKAIREFLDYFSKTSIPTLVTEEGCSEFEKRCHIVYEQLMNVQAYLFDYRIELMNTVLSEVFDKKVPERKPGDPKHKTLKELAVKEIVEKESAERELKALRREL